MQALLLIDDTESEASADVSRRRWIPLIEMLNSDGVAVDLVTLRNRWETSAFRSSSLHLHSPAGLVPAIRRLRAILRSREYGVLQAHEVVPALVAGITCLGRGSPTTVFFREHATGSGKLAVASFLTSRLNDFVFGPSAAVGRHAARDSFVTSKRFRVAPNGVLSMQAPSQDRIAHLRASLGIASGERVVLFVGRLRHEKGFLDLLESVEAVARTHQEPVHLVVVGTGPAEADFRRAALTKREFVTHFVGHRSDVADWYALADLVAIPSKRESFGLPAAEAMAASKPVVAFAVGGLTEVIEHRVTGVLVPPGNVRTFAGEILDLLNSPGTREQMGVAGLKRYQERFTIEAMTQRWHALWREIVESRSQSS